MGEKIRFAACGVSEPNNKRKGTSDDKIHRVFGQTVKLEAGWTLRRSASAVNVWQESIVSEYTGANVKLATEGAAKNNIAAGLAKLSKLTLE